ncbi:hypothetical protein N7476_005056 [Penicillium atrosanguineum]|uniref:Uncharacterized protein n=1 Tax=Penicillium atrosanguineum TaxID=1132637 RepID=A0A9W9PYQ8_9EURO|nr:hypothetical protein N7476_005056 [Penicillium atrosanguineum]
MKSDMLSRIYETRDKLVATQTISAVFQPFLRERLPIFLKTFPNRQKQRQKQPRSNKENKAYSQLKKAHAVYVEIWRIDPYILLPFIIEVSPYACERFNTLAFREQHTERYTISLDDDAKDTLDEIAQGLDIDPSPRFPDLIFFYFPQGMANFTCTLCILDNKYEASDHASSPVTGAEKDGHWTYHFTNIESIRNVFGARITQAVESSPIRMDERAEKRRNIQTTECVRTQFPRKNFQDALVIVNVGKAWDFAALLFPRTYPKILSSISNISLEASNARFSVALQQTGSALPESENHTYLTLQGASTSAIASIFSQGVYDAIESSQLRSWERSRLRLRTTDCVQMEIWRSHPQRAIISLRIGFKLGMDIANLLYDDNGAEV